MSRTASGALAAGLAALTVLVGPVASAQEAQGESSPVEANEAIGDDRVVIAAGHVDVGPRFDDGTFTLLVRDDTVDPSLWRRLPDVVLHATDAATVQVPDDPTFSFLGPPGAQVWLLPQVQQPEVLWPGWNTQDPDVATTLNREVTWTLTAVEGPGAFVLFVNQDFGQLAAIFDSRQPFPQQTGIDLNTHAHGNWTFTAPGIYRLGIEMSAVTVDGEDVTAAGTLQVAVGDTTDPQAAFAATDPPAGDVVDDDAAPAVPESTDSAEPGGRDAAATGSDGDEGAARWLGLAALSLVVAVVAAAALLVVRRRGRPQGAS